MTTQAMIHRDEPAASVIQRRASQQEVVRLLFGVP